ncbi:MAG: PQQ-binding-like beta-propeller repeat protein [Planctomycetia bacterium]
MCYRFLLLLLLLMTATAAGQDHWPRFRGNNGSGISTQKGIPTTWTDSDVAWKTELPLVGHSSPVVWGKRLFVTTATEGGTERFLHCLNADSGVEEWKEALTLSESRKHLKNSWASSTPATDGQVVCALFADGAKQIVKVWSVAGRELWERDLGSYESEHGLAVSPILQDGLVIVANDQVGPSAVLALDSQTGKTVWSTERTPGKTSYSTPVLASDGKGGTQVVCVSESSGVSGLDLRTGKVGWQTPKLPMRTVASPIAVDGLVFATCGEGGNGKYFAAIRTDLDIPIEQRIVYERKTMLPYVPCLITRDGLLFLWGDKGILVCLQLQTGKEIWTERIDGAFSGSPICIEDRLYCVTEDGTVVVVQAGPEFRELGRTALGDDCHSTPAVANGHLYFHTFHRVLAIRAK